MWRVRWPVHTTRASPVWSAGVAAGAGRSTTTAAATAAPPRTHMMEARRTFTHTQTVSADKQSSRRHASTGSTLQTVSQLEQLIATVPVEVTMFERALKVAMFERDPQCGADVWLLLDSVQPAGTPSISHIDPPGAEGGAPRRRLQHRTFPKALTYNMAIRTLCAHDQTTQRDHARLAQQLFQVARQLGYRLEVNSYRLLLGALSWHGSPDVSGLQEVFDCLLRAIAEKHVMSSFHPQPMTLMPQDCNALLYAWTQFDARTPEQRAARRDGIAFVRRTMVEHDIPLTKTIQSSLIVAAVKLDDIAEAERIIDKMYEKPDTWPAHHALESALGYYLRRPVVEILTNFPAFERLLSRIRTSQVKRPFLLSPELTEGRIEAACRYHVALLGDKKLSRLSEHDAARLLHPLLIAVRLFMAERHQFVFHKITYLHIFYAITQVAQHQQAMRTGLPYDARPSAMAALEAAAGRKQAAIRAEPPRIEFMDDVDAATIAAECLRIAVPRVLKDLASSMHQGFFTSLPVVYTFTLHLLLQTASNESDVAAILYLLDDFLLLSMQPQFVSQSVLKPPSVLMPLLHAYTNSRSATTEFPPPSHALHQLFEHQMKLARFTHFFRTQVAPAYHKSRACTAKEHELRSPFGPQAIPPSPANSGEAALGDMAFMLHDVQRNIGNTRTKKKAAQNAISSTTTTTVTTTTSGTSAPPAGEASDAADTPSPTSAVSTMAPPPLLPAGVAPSDATPDTLYLATRLLTMSVVTQLLLKLHAMYNGDQHLTSQVATRSGTLHAVALGPLLAGILDRARTYGVLDEVLRGGDMGEHFLSLMLRVPDTQPVAVTLFNHYRSKLSQDEAAGRIAVEPTSRQLYRPVMMHLAKQNQLEALEGLRHELEATGVRHNTTQLRARGQAMPPSLSSPLFDSRSLYRIECIVCGLRGDSTKLLTGFHHIMRLQPQVRDAMLNRDTMAIIVEALDRCADERAINELLSSPEASAYFLHDPAILQLLIRAIVRIEAFAARSHGASTHTLSGAVRLLTEQWGAPTQIHFGFLQHLVKCALVAEDEASTAGILAFLTDHASAPSFLRLARLDRLVSFEWPVVPVWDECAVPYPHFLFRPTSGFKSTTITLTHPSAVDIATHGREELRRVAASGDLPATLGLLSQLHHRVVAAESANAGLHATLSSHVVEEIRVAQDQCIGDAVRLLVRHAIEKGSRESVDENASDTTPVAAEVAEKTGEEGLRARPSA